MARDSEGPMTGAEFAAASEEIQALRETVREDLAEDLDGDPDDYNSEIYFRNLGSDSGEAVSDGGK